MEELQKAEIQSSYSELKRSHNYTDPEAYGIDQLKDIVKFWQKELDNPLRTSRAKQDEIEPVIQRAVHEIDCRNQEQKTEDINKAITRLAFGKIVRGN